MVSGLDLGVVCYGVGGLALRWIWFIVVCCMSAVVIGYACRLFGCLRGFLRCVLNVALCC